MKKSKILITINNLDDVIKYKKIGINHFLFGIEDFSLGNSLFKIKDLKKIEGNIYLNINKTMDCQTIEQFKKILKQFDFASGIFFDDLGVYQLMKDSNIPLIWNQTHFVLNSRAINSWLGRVDSAYLSNELTFEEISYILEHTAKPLILNVFGSNIAMYSRRPLLNSYSNARGIKIPNNVILKTNNSTEFLAYESEAGLIMYNRKYFNYLEYLDKLNDDKILLYSIDGVDLSFKDVVKIIEGKYPESDERFLLNKTIYKLED